MKAPKDNKIDFKEFYNKNIITPEQYKENHLLLFSPIPISVNHYMKPRGYIINIKGKPTSQVSMYETAEAKYFKYMFSEYVKQEVKKQKWNIEPTKTRHHYMDCVFYFPRIDMDEQNYYKILCDSINNIAYYDDHFILTIPKRIYYDSENPRIEIDLHMTEYIGIFDNEDKLTDFRGKCVNCKRFDKNCSVLNKGIEGRIQEEIVKNENNEFECQKFSEVKTKKNKKGE